MACGNYTNQLSSIDTCPAALTSRPVDRPSYCSRNGALPPSIVCSLLTLMLILTTFASDKRFGLVYRVKGTGRELNRRQRA